MIVHPTATRRAPRLRAAHKKAMQKIKAIAAAPAARALLRPPSHPAALSLARPFAARTLASAAAGPSDDGKLTPEQEHKKRIDMMFAEKTLREVEAAGAERRPEGVSHVLESDERQTAAASAHSADRGEVGGPRGAEPTRFGDWERGGRASDF